MPMFPDSGVPPGQAINTLPEVSNVPTCDELWYSTSRCQPRFDPAAANAMLAEDMNIVIRGEVQYDCLKLDNMERAIRYINQRGLPRSIRLLGGPFAYNGQLDPIITRYSDYMTLTAVPIVENQGAVTIDIDGKGPVPLLRNDGQQLKSKDIRSNIPFIMAFFAGNWYHVGLVLSQVLVLSPALDFWIRTDGNDVTGDGTANHPDKAFRTIAGCWYAVGSRYAATPSFAINMRLGIPGTYAGAAIGPFGGNVSLMGDPANPSAYRISSMNFYPGLWGPLWISSIASMGITGISLLMERGNPDGCAGLIGVGSGIAIGNSRIELLVSNTNTQSSMISMTDSAFGFTAGNVHLLGNGNSVGSCCVGTQNGSYRGAWFNPGESSTVHFSSINVTWAAFVSVALSTMHWGVPGFTLVNGVSGPQYYVAENSIINMMGTPIPGSTPGTMASGGKFIA